MDTLHYLLMKTHTLLQRKIISEATKLGLSSGQPKILDCLSEYEGSDQKTIAEYCEIEQATAGSILTGMENTGLIVRKQKQGNRRSLFIYLTDKGKTVSKDMKAVFDNADLQATSALSEQELEQLKSLLNKICISLKNESEG